ncbi:hypothetical protein Tcan_05814 [Toxocara canis]|uniref:Uncharacterized protein n=1 Tax=Toxocara canis TaxID=6265 RepID=A0A0B2URX5_TOXCA|nr:hypothetical protein Tcan_05814 [Toxocara canis]
MVQFDRQIFDETIPLTFWHEVRARKLFRLPINITVFFQYPMRSNNITYSMSAERGSPTIRSVSKSDELLQVSDSDMDDQDRSIDINLDGIKIPGVYKNALMHKLLTKYFTQMVIGSIALMFLFLIAFGVLVWFCCANEETKNFSKVNPRRTHAMHANVVDSSL